jgi:hypothetical protein
LSTCGPFTSLRSRSCFLLHARTYCGQATSMKSQYAYELAQIEANDPNNWCAIPCPLHHAFSYHDAPVAHIGPGARRRPAQLLPVSYIRPSSCLLVVGDREIQSTNRQRELYHHLYTELDHKVTRRRALLVNDWGPSPSHLTHCCGACGTPSHPPPLSLLFSCGCRAWRWARRPWCSSRSPASCATPPAACPPTQTTSPPPQTPTAPAPSAASNCSTPSCPPRPR